MTAEPRTLTLRGGELAVVGPDGRIRREPGDLAIVDGEITAVGHVPSDRGEVVDARGLLVMPGVIDPQVHFREPGLTHKEDLHTGSAACAAGGVTAFLEMPNTDPPTTDQARLDGKLARAKASSIVHYGFFVGATKENADTVASIVGSAGVKVFMGSSTGTLLVDDPDAQERVFASGRKLIAVHAEDEPRLAARKRELGGVADPARHPVIRDELAALLATTRALELAERHRRRLHVLHVSTAEEVELLGARRSVLVSAEVTPQHLTLVAPEVYERLGTFAQMNPPLRDARHARALWAALRDGRLTCVATDHAPHTKAEKSRPYGEAPSGMPGVETSLAVMLDAAHRGHCSVEEVVSWMTEGPARAYGLKRRGRLAPGFFGDVTLVDLGRVRAIDDGPIRTKCGWSPYAGVKLRGWPVLTIVRGQIAFREGDLFAEVRGDALDLP